MNLVNELQVSAESDDVLTVLRKARRLASKLGVPDIDDWLKAEQNGYESHQAIPKYRIVRCSLVYETNGPIPAGFGRLRSGIFDYPGGHTTDRPMVDSMGGILTTIEIITSGQRSLFMPLMGDTTAIRSAFDPYIAHQLTFMLRLSTAEIRAIPEAVKDKILDWACELERRGVLGDDMTFNEKERALAHTITFNLSNCSIEQLTNSGTNTKR